MNVLLVITKADEIGGAQTHVLDLCHELTKNGHVAKVLVGENGMFVDRLYEMGIDVTIETKLNRDIDFRKDLAFIMAFRKFIIKSNPDLIHLHSTKAGLLGRIAAFGLSQPVIFTVHGWSFAEGIPDKKRKLYTLIERMTSGLASQIITVSQHDKELALKHSVACCEKISVIHNGIPQVPFNETFNRSEKSTKLIMVARFSEQKDHETLCSALNEIKDLDWQLDLVGKGRLLDKTKKLVDELGLSDRVNFLGERNDVVRLLAQSDIFCLISNWEGFPISILEAMRLNLPIVASDVGGVSEAVKDGYNGFLVPRKDNIILSKKLRELITNKSFRDELGNNSFGLYHQYFTSDVMFNKTMSVYQIASKR